MKRFHSRIGPELLIPAIFLTSYFFYTAITAFNWAALTITGAVIIFLVYMCLSTSYFIYSTTLEIKCGVFYDRLINIDTIKTIREVTDIFGAPATSVKRLEIRYNESESIAISPRHQFDFIKILQQINPNIKIVHQPS